MTDSNAEGRPKRAPVLAAALATLIAASAVLGVGAPAAQAAEASAHARVSLEQVGTAQPTAAARARGYLEAMAMSREALIEQLTYAGEAPDAAAAAVESLAIDWAEQAAIAAAEYAEVEALTPAALLAQLVSDGYEAADAAAAVGALGVDWEQQPYDAALEYRGLQEYAQSEVIDRILWLAGEEDAA